MEQDKYLILCANCAHPSGRMVYFLLSDEDGDTVEFNSEDEAREWCASQGDNSPFAYTILCTGDFVYEFTD